MWFAPPRHWPALLGVKERQEWVGLGTRVPAVLNAGSKLFAVNASAAGSPASPPRYWRPTSPIVDLVVEIAARKQITPGQVAPAWLLAKSPTTVPVHGSR